MAAGLPKIRRKEPSTLFSLLYFPSFLYQSVFYHRTCTCPRAMMKNYFTGRWYRKTKYTNNRINIVLNDKGKPFERMGRKANGLMTLLVYGGRVTEFWIRDLVWIYMFIFLWMFRAECYLDLNNVYKLYR